MDWHSEVDHSGLEEKTAVVAIQKRKMAEILMPFAVLMELSCLLLSSVFLRYVGELEEVAYIPEVRQHGDRWDLWLQHTFVT